MKGGEKLSLRISWRKLSWVKKLNISGRMEGEVFGVAAEHFLIESRSDHH